MPTLKLKDGTSTEDPRLDRLVQFDERSRNYPIRELLRAEQTPRSYTWRVPLRLDQGRLGACVSFSWHHELAARPVMVPGVTNELARRRYCAMQTADPWDGQSQSCGGPGPYYEGTSVLAGAQVLKAEGLIREYRWAFSFEDVVLALGYRGPGIAGLPWYEGMMRTDAKGYVHPTGGVVGGHAVCVNRVSVKERFVGIANTWSQAWGMKDAWGLGGSCRISFDDFERLLDERGEFCVPVVRALG